MEPEALDDHVAKLHRGMAGEEPRPAHPLGEASGYPPNCVHGMNSFADGALPPRPRTPAPRLTVEPQTSIERNHPCPRSDTARMAREKLARLRRQEV